jgi:hypothetical protein
MADIPTDNPYSFRSFKTCASLSEETVAFSAILCRDGKKLAQAKNAGHGGSNDLFWLDREAQAAFLAYVKTVPPVPFEVDGKTEMLDMDPDFFISCMVQVEEEKAVREKNRKRFAKLCSTQVLFRKRGDKSGTWGILKTTDMAAAKAWLAKNVGMDKLEAILNELLPSDPDAWERF